MTTSPSTTRRLALALVAVVLALTAAPAAAALAIAHGPADVYVGEDALATRVHVDDAATVAADASATDAPHAEASTARPLPTSGPERGPASGEPTTAEEDGRDAPADDERPPRDTSRGGLDAAVADTVQRAPVAVDDATDTVDAPAPSGVLARVAAAVTGVVEDARAALAPSPYAAAAPAGSTESAGAGGVAGPVGPDEVRPGTAAVVLAAAGAAALGWAAGGGSALAQHARRLLGVLGVGGFTRLQKARLLDHDARQSLVEHVRAQPGTSLKDLMDATGLGRSSVTYHLRVLEREGMLKSTREGRRRLYFPVGAADGPGPREAPAVAALAHDTARAIAERVRAAPGVDQSGLCADVGLTPSLAHWHARRLEAAGVLRRERDGRRVRYYPGPLADALVQART